MIATCRETPIYIYNSSMIANASEMQCLFPAAALPTGQLFQDHLEWSALYLQYPIHVHVHVHVYMHVQCIYMYMYMSCVH